jgi:hypothetical protein
MLVIFLGITAKFALAADTGTISGTVSDPQGSVVPGVTVQLTAVETGVIQNVETDGAGFYRFPALPLGHYDITFSKAGFEKFETKGLLIDVDSALHADATLKVGSTSEQVTVTTTEAQVETESAQIGQVIGGKEMEDIPLDGRAYTDLLALQPGVVPFNASLFGVIGPQNGTLNAGALDISGGQETHNGYMVNGANVVEGYEGGTFLIPVLDSIAEFRIITADANAEYGNYSGGLVNVVTKSGTNQFHGDAFEFNRNTDYDADDYFAKSKGVYHQNQFGGTLGGPIWRNHLFAFGDWQKTHNTQGASSGNQYVPDTAELGGNFSDEATRMASSVTLGSGTSAVTEAVPSQVSGPNFASSLTSGLGYTVTNGEPYYFYAGEYLPGGTSGQYESSCTSTDQCVFPNATIPSGAIATLSPPAPNYIKLIPGQTVLTTPGNPGYFVSNAYPSTLDDDKGGVRIDADTKIGTVSGYYHVDPWKQLSPYAGWGGSTVPGFPSEAKGKAQLYVVGLTSRFGSSAVNVLSVNWTKNTNSSLNSPTDAGTTPQSFGFAAPTSDGIFTTAPGFVNIPGVSFNSFGLGPPNTVLSQNDNLYGIQDDFSKVIGVHTFKFGGAYHTDKYDVGHVDNASDGDFVFNGEETGIDFADFLIGAPSTFYEGTPSVLNLRNYYVGIYGQDTWRINSHLTANLGLRWDVDPFWEDTHNASPVVRYGVQSTQYPTAPAGYVFPGHDGIARRSGALTRFNNLGPRISLAYTPHVADGFLHSIFGDESKSSIRAGYGMYYTNVEGANTFNFSAPPTHLFYYQSIPVYFAQPFLNRDSGVDLGQRFPVPVVDPATINWAEYEPLSSFSSPLAKSKTPYEEHIDVSFERQLASNIVMDVTYVGTFGHHLIIAGDNNPGDPALCLSVSQPDETTDGITCGPGGEGGTYHPITGGTIDTTRGPYGPNFGNNQDELDIGNSAYNALEATLRRTGTRLSLLFAYTYSKSIDNGSGFGDQVFEYGNHNAFRSPSYYNLPQNFAASYTWEMPWDLLFKKNNQVTRGWKLSGQTHFTDGTPVEILETDDRSLVGSSGLTFAGSTDEPDVQFGSGQSFYGDKNPRHGKAYINVSLYSQEPLGGQGNAPRRFLHGPGEDNWDAALLKDIKIHENISFELRGEFFNVFNHVQFYGGGIVNGNFANGLPSQGGSFGLVGGDAGARVGQVAGKLYF